MIPSKSQWKKWVLTSKASYLGAWIGLAGTLIGAAGAALAVYFYINPMPSPPSASDEFVRRTNPVVVELLGVSILRWEGDSEDAITATFKNAGSVPADRLTVEIGDMANSLPAFASVAFRNVSKDGVSIEPGAETQLPVIGVQQLSSLLGADVCSVTMEPPSTHLPAPVVCPGETSVHQFGLYVKVRYQTMFGEQRTGSTRIWVNAAAKAAG